MDARQRVVAIISPWDKLGEVAKRQFRIESLPRERKVMVWRDDLQDEGMLAAELARIGLAGAEIVTRRPTDWKAVQ